LDLKTLLYVTLTFACWALSAKAETDIEGSYSLIGVIADDRSGALGVAVIKDLKTGRIITLRTGQALPGQQSLILRKVANRRVVIGNDLDSFDLAYNGSSLTRNIATDEANEDHFYFEDYLSVLKSRHRENFQDVDQQDRREFRKKEKNFFFGDAKRRSQEVCDHDCDKSESIENDADGDGYEQDNVEFSELDSTLLDER
tara:strand:- start:3187 stop:3786 length:600 start_codon:yes stop_codon:yes gene_type:complete